VSHCDAEWLALRALGESDTGPDEAHLASCAQCRGELDALATVAATARTVTVADRPADPPPEVWQRITAELQRPADAADTPGRAAGGEPAAAPVVELRPRRRTLLVGVAAALVGLLAGSVTTAALVRRPPATSVVATVRLAPLPDQTAQGTAVLKQEAGADVLTVDVRGLNASPAAFYEVWLMSPDTNGLVALGVLGPADQGTFEVPKGLDLSRYSVVDVSVEPFDGNPAHSSDSIVRGTLPV
jgi:hypothetical protein